MEAYCFFFFVSQDMHGKTEAGLTPKKDVSQDYELLASVQNGSHISVVFRRAWDTCDEHDDVMFGVSETCMFFFSYMMISFGIEYFVFEARVYVNRNRLQYYMSK